MLHDPRNSRQAAGERGRGGDALAPIAKLYSCSTGNNPADLGKLEPEFLYETADIDIGGRDDDLVFLARACSLNRRDILETRNPIRIDLEPLHTQLEIVPDARKDAFTPREHFARGCSCSETRHTHLSLSDHGLDRIVGIA